MSDIMTAAEVRAARLRYHRADVPRLADTCEALAAALESELLDEDSAGNTYCWRCSTVNGHSIHCGRAALLATWRGE